MYIHEHNDWPNFTWDEKLVLETIMHVKYAHGRLLGRMESICLESQKESVLATITEDVIKSNEIEGEFLDADQVRSSVARRIGLDIMGLKNTKPRIDAIVKMMMDATQNFHLPLTKERLFAWHKSLFTGTYSTMIISHWRDDMEGPMQVISGVIGRIKIHFQAPEAESIPIEMEKFIIWFNAQQNMDYMIKAAIAHLWFVTLHPFDDGNGRIARTITDMLLARLENSSQRFYSMSSQILIERKDYYNILEKTQKGDLNITGWLVWFLNCMHRAIENTDKTLSKVINKAKFWQKYGGVELSLRQITILNMMMDKRECNITSSQYAKLAGCSQDTAHRDILHLIENKLLSASLSRGRSMYYEIASV